MSERLEVRRMLNEVEIDGQVIRLTLKQSDLMAEMARRNRPMTYSQILIHGGYKELDEYVDVEKSAHIRMFHLRQRLAGTPIVIENVRGIGYQIVLLDRAEAA